MEAQGYVLNKLKCLERQKDCWYKNQLRRLTGGPNCLFCLTALSSALFWPIPDNTTRKSPVSLNDFLLSSFLRKEALIERTEGIPEAVITTAGALQQQAGPSLTSSHPAQEA